MATTLLMSKHRTFQGYPKYSYGLSFSSSYKDFEFYVLQKGGFNAAYRNLMGGQYSNASTDIC
jgi:hypothetical protein